MGKRTTYHPPNWQCINPDKSKNRFVPLYRDLFFSKAFQSLTKCQQLLYINMTFEYNPSTEVEHPDGDINKFWFNKDRYKNQYKLYSNDNQFYKDRDELIKKGFIEQVKGGYTTRDKSIYKFSKRWQKYDPNKEFELKPNERTGSMMNWGRHNKSEK